MTESPATKAADGDVGHRAKNGLKPGSNGLLKSLHRCHERQPEHHHCQPEEEEVRPGMGRGGWGKHPPCGPRRMPFALACCVYVFYKYRNALRALYYRMSGSRRSSSDSRALVTDLTPNSIGTVIALVVFASLSCWTFTHNTNQNLYSTQIRNVR